MCLQNAIRAVEVFQHILGLKEYGGEPCSKSSPLILLLPALPLDTGAISFILLFHPALYSRHVGECVLVCVCVNQWLVLRNIVSHIHKDDTLCTSHTVKLWEYEWSHISSCSIRTDAATGTCDARYHVPWHDNVISCVLIQGQRFTKLSSPATQVTAGLSDMSLSLLSRGLCTSDICHMTSFVKAKTHNTLRYQHCKSICANKQTNSADGLRVYIQLLPQRPEFV